MKKLGILIFVLTFLGMPFFLYADTLWYSPFQSYNGNNSFFGRVSDVPKECMWLAIPRGASTIEAYTVSVAKRGSPTDGLLVNAVIDGVIVATSSTVVGSTLTTYSVAPYGGEAVFTFEPPIFVLANDVTFSLCRSGALDNTNYYALKYWNSSIGAGALNDLMPNDFYSATSFPVSSTTNNLLSSTGSFYRYWGAVDGSRLFDLGFVEAGGTSGTMDIDMASTTEAIYATGYTNFLAWGLLFALIFFATMFTFTRRYL